jgi:hypothetical protein
VELSAFEDCEGAAIGGECGGEVRWFVFFDF